MRLGVVTTSYPREPGDPAGRFVGELSRAFVTAGHEVEVVAAGPGCGRDGEIAVLRIDGAGLFYGEGAPDRLERTPGAWIHTPRFVAAQAAAVARRAPAWDAIVSHWLAPSGLVAAAAGHRRPHLAIAHSGDVHLVARRGVADAVAVGLAGARLAFVSERLRARLLEAITLPPLRRALAARSLVCPMGVDVGALRRAGGRARGEARAVLGLPAGGAIVGALGRLVPIKGIGTLVDAAALADVTLAVGGDGPERGALAARAAARGVRLHLLGELRGERRDALFAAVDLLAVPSVPLPGGRTEGAPVVVLEALAAGLPLVASETGGIAEQVGEAALLVPPGEPGPLAAAIHRLLTDGERRAELVAAGRAQAAAHDWARVTARLLGAFA